MQSNKKILADISGIFRKIDWDLEKNVQLQSREGLHPHTPLKYFKIKNYYVKEHK